MNLMGATKKDAPIVPIDFNWNIGKNALTCKKNNWNNKYFYLRAGEPEQDLVLRLGVC